MRFFNKPSDWAPIDWFASDARALLSDISLTVYKGKDDHYDYYSSIEDRQNWWDNLSEKDKNVIKELSTEEWTTQNDERRSRIVVEATNIGHDINYGVSELKKFQKSDRDAPAQGNGTPANPGLPPSPGGGTATAGAGQQADAHPVHPTPVTFDNLGEETPTDNPQAAQTQETSQAQEFGSGFAESPLDESTTEDMRPAGEAEF